MKMINKDNDNQPKPQPEVVDTAKMDVQCHLVIKDKSTNRVLINKRG